MVCNHVFESCNSVKHYDRMCGKIYVQPYKQCYKCGRREIDDTRDGYYE
jgi:hypothetical protein